MNMQALKKVKQARTTLLLDNPFFGQLALRLKLQEDPTCQPPTAWVDGVTMGYHPDFVLGLSSDELIGLIAHEVMHCAYGHPWRRDAREPKRWNIAADHAINLMLTQAHFKLPADGYCDPRWAGRSSEWIYDRLPPSKDDDGIGYGEVRDAPSGTDAGTDSPNNTEASWKQAAAQAAQMAKGRGMLPAGLERFIDALKTPKVDWRSLLRRFIQALTNADYAWQYPSRRFMAAGLYLPMLRSEQCGPIAVAVDTSGSIDDVTLGQFASEINAIMSEAQPERITVMYCDAKVQHVDTFERGEFVTLNMHGGGGTDFRPAFTHVADMEDQPVAIVYLTDLQGTFPVQAPDLPTLWISTYPGVAPFGETVSIQ